MALSYALDFTPRALDQVERAGLVAGVRGLTALWVDGPRREPPAGGLQLGRMIDSMRGRATLSFVFDGSQTRAKQGLFSAHKTRMDLTAKMYAFELVYELHRRVSCHATDIPGTYIPLVDCRWSDIPVLEQNLVVVLTMDARIKEILPVAGGYGGGILVELEVKNWEED